MPDPLEYAHVDDVDVDDVDVDDDWVRLRAVVIRRFDSLDCTSPATLQLT